MTLEQFAKDLENDFKNLGFSINRSIELLPDSWMKHTADFVIRYEQNNKTNFAVLVTTSKSKVNNISVSYAKRAVRQMVYDYDYWIGLVWHEGVLWLFDPTKKENPLRQWEKIKYEDLLEYAKQHINSEIPESYKQDLISNLESYSTDSNVENNVKSAIEEWLESVSQDDLEQVNRMVTVSLENQFELLRRLFNSLNFKPLFKFCRYTTIEGLKRILLDRQESMCGLAGMNDKSEGFFLDKCLTNASYNLYRKPQTLINRFNEVFILSLCDESKKDDLTMWRLYGNDGKGCCLIYEPDADALRKSTEFILLPITYGNSGNPIVLLFKILSKLPYINGLRFGMSYKYIWQYFVKPQDFKIESEYRLLYVPQENNSSNPKWILNSNYSIFHPIQIFPSPLINEKSNFPMKLKEVILGPKCQESLINKVQIKSLIADCQHAPVITLSKIDFYR